jgi:hypothetical protein
LENDTTDAYAANIYGQLRKEIQEFFNKHIHIAGSKLQETARYLDTYNRRYVFNQWENINLIDLYYNSKFESGMYDTEGQRKLFLNVVKFRADVAAKQTQIQVKDFDFIPEEGESVWPSYFMGKEFSYWAKENFFGELLDKCVDAFPRYGWVILKEVKGKLDFVPLQTVRCQQDAKSIQEARYFTIEHPKMSLEEMKDMKAWNTDGINLKPGECDTVYERYGLVRQSEYNKYKGLPVEQGDDTTMIDCLTIMTYREKLSRTNDPATGKPRVEESGHILFMETIDRKPFIDVKWDTQHGRLMGIGEIENLFENQIGTNMAWNLFRRQLLWTSKKIFQSTDGSIARNLVKDVKDGDVLQIAPNGQVTPINIADMATSDFNAFLTTLDGNSNSKAFTFDAATGASSPSGTPFKLGVMMANTVASYFDKQKNKMGLFFKRAMKEHVIPSWKSEFDEEHIISMFSDEEGFEDLKQIAIDMQVGDEVKKQLLAGNVPDIDAVTAATQMRISKNKFLFVKIPDNYYDDIDYKVTLTITGDAVDLNKKIELYTNLYTALVQAQDPRAEIVMKKLLDISGENPDMLGAKAPPPEPMNNQPPQDQGNMMPGSAPRPTMLPNALPATPNKTM